MRIERKGIDMVEKDAMSRGRGKDHIPASTLDFSNF
jgi:hypothetical protein